MELSWIDTNDRSFTIVLVQALKINALALAVFSMHSLDFPKICAVLDNIIVKLVEERSCCQFGTRKLPQRVQTKIIDINPYGIACKGTNTKPNNVRSQHMFGRDEAQHDCELNAIELTESSWKKNDKELS